MRLPWPCAISFRPAGPPGRVVARSALTLALLAAVAIAPLAARAARGERAATARDLGARLASRAKELIDVEFDLGGRLQRGRGIDCQGLVFWALERETGCGWKSFSVMPAESIARHELGTPVVGVSPVRSDRVDLRLLRPGDVLYFLASTENPQEKYLTTLEAASDPGEALPTPVWVWHMGLYAGDGLVIHADPYVAGKVVEQPLSELLAGFDGLYATRLQGRPRPKRCRQHRAMPLPLPRAESATSW